MQLIVKYRDLRTVSLFLLMLVILLAFPSSPGDGLDYFRSWFYLTIAVLGVCLHLSRQQSDNWLRPDTVFLLGFFVVHYQWLLMALLSGLFPESTSFLYSMELHANYGAWISTIALLTWLAGYAMANPCQHVIIERASNYQVMMGLAFAVFISFIFFVGPKYFTAELYRTVQENFFQTVTGIAAYFLTISEILTIILLSLFFYPLIVKKINRDVKINTIDHLGGFHGIHKQLLMLYFVIYIGAFLLAAERGQVIQLLSASGIIYAMNFRAIRFSELLLLILIAALLFTAIGIARSLEGDFNFDLIFGDAGYWALTQNLANSSITLYQGIDLIESGNELFYGQLWLSQILGLVPFLQSIFLEQTSFKLEEINSATQITTYILGSNPHTGFGTSFVIDVYLNFGVPGILMAFLLHGYVCKVVSKWITGTCGFKRFFVAVAFVSLLFYLSRSSLLIQLRPVVWGLVIIMLLVSIRRRRV